VKEYEVVADFEDIFNMTEEDEEVVKLKDFRKRLPPSDL